MPYSVTDGFLRAGADVRAARNVTDGLLFAAGPSGSAPPDIHASGTVTSTALPSGVESLADAGQALSVAALSAVETLTDRGVITSTALHLGGEAAASFGAVTSTALLDGRESLADKGVLVSIALLSGDGARRTDDPRPTRAGWVAVRDPGMLTAWIGSASSAGSGRIVRVTKGRIRRPEEP